MTVLLVHRDDAGGERYELLPLIHAVVAPLPARRQTPRVATVTTDGDVTVGGFPIMTTTALQGYTAVPDVLIDDRAIAPEHKFLYVYLLLRLDDDGQRTSWPGMEAMADDHPGGTYVVALAATAAGRPALIRSPKRVLAHCREGLL